MRIEVDINNLKQDKAELEQHIEKITQYTTELNELSNGLQAMWEGAACVSYQKRLEEDIQFIHALTKDMDRYVQCLSYSIGEYSKCENNVISEINRIRI